MRNEFLESLLASVGVPIAYRKFKPYKNKPVPNPPYMIYIIEQESGRGADNKNLLFEKTVFLELYSVSKNEVLEEKIENALCALEWDKYEDYMENEKLYVISYEFKFIQKIRSN